MRVDPATAPTLDRGGVRTLHLSDAGGLTQFGAYRETLSPGAVSSDRHWHTSEDEFLFVLDGTATVIDDDGAHVLTRGDAVCWRHGDPYAHHVQNLSNAAVTYLIVGTRVAGDICHYPDSGRRQVNGATDWQVLDAGGAVLRGGDLPPELRNLPAVWGQDFDGTALPRIHRADGRVWVTEDGYSHPVLGGGLGPYGDCILGDAGGLSQFGAHLERLPAHSKSSFRHWHEAEDEFLYVLSGTPTLIEDSETLLHPGDAGVWPAGRPLGHCLANRTDGDVIYVVIGTRLRTDRIHYPDHDLITEKDGPARRYFRADGSPRERRTE
ncbi:MAG: cupin domain-containing protein [Pseudomonadota bacterium]